MQIYLGTDHGGFKLKEEVKSWLLEQKYDVVDLGATHLEDDDDFVPPAIEVAGALQDDWQGRGILFCRNGFGMVIVANRFEKVRCGLAFNEKAVENGRHDDDINCLAIPADYFDVKQVKAMINVFLHTNFSDETRFVRRLKQIEEIGDDCGGGCCGGNCGCQHDK